MEAIPCKDCISFAICNSFSQDYNSDKYIVCPDVLMKCEIIGWDRDQLEKIRVLFRPDLIEENRSEVN